MKAVWKWSPILAFAALCGCGGAEDVSQNTLLVTLKAGNTFSPQTVTVKGGQSVTWVNQDAMAHTITGDTSPGPNSDAKNPTGLTKGQTYFWKVPNAVAGTKFFYHCRFHGTAGDGTDFGTGMTGVIVVQ